MRRAGDGRVDVLLVDGVTHLGAVLLVALLAIAALSESLIIYEYRVAHI